MDICQLITARAQVRFQGSPMGFAEKGAEGQRLLDDSSFSIPIVIPPMLHMQPFILSLTLGMTHTDSIV